VKTLAFVFGLCVGAFGVVGILVPSGPAWLAREFVTPGAFYAIAAVRITFGFILIKVAPASRMPRALRVLGFVVLLLGVTAALVGAAEIERARSMIEWWLQQGAGVERLTAVLILALGGFVAYACAPIRGAAAERQED
jgi:hypothetical protein